MKKQIIIAAVAVLTLGVSGTAFAKQGEPKVDKTVTICHANGKQGMLRLVVNENATNGHFENNGTTKQGHEDDVLKQGEQACDEPVVVVVDVCENLPDVQTVVPVNHVLEGKNCTEQDAGDYTDGKEEPVTTPEVVTTPDQADEPVLETFQGK